MSKFEVVVKDSPVIKECFVFGFTDNKKAHSLEKALKSISVSGHPNVKVCELDMCFGHIVVTLPNPSIDLDEYKNVRIGVVQSIKNMVEGSENGS